MTKQRETAVLVMSDLHFGKETATYNPDVFRKRLARLGERLGRIHDLLSDYEFDELVIACLGDANDGTDIYATQPHHQAISNVEEQAIELARLLDRFGTEQANIWGRVRWECVPGNHGRCHDAETELLTREGWKTHDQLREGELVATYRLSDGRCEWQPLLAIYRYQHNGTMYAVQNRENNFLVSPNHRMVITEGSTIIKPFIVEMQALYKRQPYDWRLPRVARGSQNDFEEVTDDELRLVGWLLTDGCYKRRRNHTSVLIYQSKEDGIAKIKALLDRLGYGYTQRVRVRPGTYDILGFECKTRRPAYEFYIRAAYTKRVLELLPDKHKLPDWVWNLSERQTRVLLEALLDGDGSRWKRNSRVLYGKKPLLDQVQGLLLVNNIPCTVRTNRRGPYLSIGMENGRGSYITVSRKNMRPVEYSGIAWCGAVPNGTLITRRNGCPLISGNSGARAAEAANWDIVAYRYLAMLNRDDRVQVHVPEQRHGDVFLRLMRIYNHGYLLYHGHDIRSYATIPWYGMSRRLMMWSISKKVAGWQVGLMGHFHTSGMWRINRLQMLLTGTMVTDDEWALRTLGWESSNSWWLFGASRKRPITWTFELDLVSNA